MWRALSFSWLAATALSAALPAWAADFEFLARRREASATPGGEAVVRESPLSWKPEETAIVLCDLWDEHWCKGASQRVQEMAPKINELLKKAREAGALVIHSPSDCMEFYKDTPQRRLAIDAPQAQNTPEAVRGWCRRLADEPALPIDDSDGGCDCAERCGERRAWKRQIATVEIGPNDAISDRGEEIWNLLEARGIRHVALCGVHTNMCVVGRPFGLQNLVQGGKDVVLVRDLTDSMYNSRRSPFVAHRRGTELVVAHIERHICPTVESDDFLGAPRPKTIVIVIGEDEYDTARTLPEFAKTVLGDYRVEVIHADADDKNRFPGIEETLPKADLLVLSVRRRTPPMESLAAIRNYLDAGRPLVGIRTASHAFEPRPQDDFYPGHARWDTFDIDVLGVDYQGHYGHPAVEGQPDTRVRRAATAGDWPLADFGDRAVEFPSWLYKSKHPAQGVRVLLEGEKISTGEREPVAWTNHYRGGRVFYTSLGIPAEFERPEFRNLLRQGIEWALEREVR